MKTFRKVLTWLLIGFIVYLGIKPMIVSSYKLNKYVFVDNMIEGEGAVQIFFTPNREMIFITETKNGFGLALYNINQGMQATHYFGGLYLFDRTPFGLRYYSDAEMVFETKLKLIKKKGDGFPDVGDEIYSKIMIGKKRAIINGKEYVRGELDADGQAEIEEMIRNIREDLN